MKIGISIDPEARIRQLQTGQSDKLILYHTERLDIEHTKLFEKILHRDHRHLMVRGEWFRMSVEYAISYIGFTVIHYESKSINEIRYELGLKKLPFTH